MKETHLQNIFINNAFNTDVLYVLSDSKRKSSQVMSCDEAKLLEDLLIPASAPTFIFCYRFVLFPGKCSAAFVIIEA